MSDQHNHEGDDAVVIEGDLIVEGDVVVAGREEGTDADAPDEGFPTERES